MMRRETSPDWRSEVPQENRKPLERARRTAFISRFIVLRESKRSRAHRIIEQLTWHSDTTAEELAAKIRNVFLENGDNMGPVDRDLRRALAHASKSIKYFVKEYNERSTVDFVAALYDYERSNSLLFGDDEIPRQGGWRLPKDLERERQKLDA
jgi:hypothetical protein